MNKTQVLCVVLSALAAAWPVAVSRASDGVEASFVEYIKQAANPDRHGLRKDGRFYPYSSPQGRRIGYRQPVSDKKMYRDGWAVADADRALRERLKAVEAELREWLGRERNRDWSQLPAESREILLDFAFTESVGKLKPDFVDAVLRLDWKRILVPGLYARYEADWPDSVRNKAFYERWKAKLEGGK
jgi:hypothetical protein